MSTSVRLPMHDIVKRRQRRKNCRAAFLCGEALPLQNHVEEPKMCERANLDERFKLQKQPAREFDRPVVFPVFDMLSPVQIPIKTIWDHTHTHTQTCERKSYTQ